jgi:hypothetical protein
MRTTERIIINAFIGFWLVGAFVNLVQGNLGLAVIFGLCGAFAYMAARTKWMGW